MNRLRLTVTDVVLAGCTGVDFILCESLEKFSSRILKHLHIVQ